MVYIGFDTTCGFGHPLGVSEHVPHGEGGAIVPAHRGLSWAPDGWLEARGRQMPRNGASAGGWHLDCMSAHLGSQPGSAPRSGEKSRPCSADGRGPSHAGGSSWGPRPWPDSYPDCSSGTCPGISCPETHFPLCLPLGSHTSRDSSPTPQWLQTAQGREGPSLPQPVFCSSLCSLYCIMSGGNSPMGTLAVEPPHGPGLLPIPTSRAAPKGWADGGKTDG